VEDLVTRRLLRETGEKFEFAHDRIREVIYAQLVTPRRRLLHRRVAHAMEMLRAQHLAPHYAALALHYREGHVCAEAVKYLHLAGRQALDRAAHREALSLLERALAVLEELPATPARLERALDVHIDLRNAMHPIADAAATLDRLREAEALATRLGDQARLAQVLCHLADQYGNVGDYARAVDAGDRALAIAEALGDFGLRVVANARLGRVHHARGEYERAVARFAENVDVLTGAHAGELFGLPQPASVHSGIGLVGALAELGRFPQARERAERIRKRRRVRA
jgi:predicted ATPase